MSKFWLLSRKLKSATSSHLHKLSVKREDLWEGQSSNVSNFRKGMEKTSQSHVFSSQSTQLNCFSQPPLQSEELLCGQELSNGRWKRCAPLLRLAPKNLSCIIFHVLPPSAGSCTLVQWPWMPRIKDGSATGQKKSVPMSHSFKDSHTLTRNTYFRL